MSDTMTVQRPPDMSDGRWEVIQSMTHLIVTGHMPWCTDHEGDVHEGWCRQTFKSFACDVELHNGTTTGEVHIALYPHPGVNDTELTVLQAASIAGTLRHAAETASHFQPAAEAVGAE